MARAEGGCGGDGEAAAPPAAPFGSRSIQAEGGGDQPDEEEPPCSCRAGKASAAARSPSDAAVVPTNTGDDTYVLYLKLLLPLNFRS